MKFSQGLLMLFFKMWISLQTCSQYSTYLYSQDLTSNYGTWTKLIKVPICKWGIFFKHIYILNCNKFSFLTVADDTLNIFIFWTAINLVYWLLQTTLSNINSVDFMYCSKCEIFLGYIIRVCVFSLVFIFNYGEKKSFNWGN